MPVTKQELRDSVRERLDDAVAGLNRLLSGEEVDQYEEILRRVGRGGKLPHWYEQLRGEHTLPNLDGKTIGSVVEMLFLGVLEKTTLADLLEGEPLSVNPARGVDFPDLDLNVKAPSENFCTSEPFTSAYERLIGSHCDALVLLTDYQTQKRSPPLRLQVIKWEYLSKTQIADRALCALAIKHRDRLIEQREAWAKDICQFLAYVNQSDWRARHLLRIVEHMDDSDAVLEDLERTRADFEQKNAERARRDKVPIPDDELEKLLAISEIEPIEAGVVQAVHEWVLDNAAEFARLPNENEWQRFVEGPLDGRIGMSFALQWRYNFGWLFGARDEIEDEEVVLAVEQEEVVE